MGLIVDSFAGGGVASGKLRRVCRSEDRSMTEGRFVAVAWWLCGYTEKGLVILWPADVPR